LAKGQSLFCGYCFLCVVVPRLVVEDDKVFIYHNLDNSRMLHSNELQCIEVEPPVRCSFTLQKLTIVAAPYSVCSLLLFLMHSFGSSALVMWCLMEADFYNFMQILCVVCQAKYLPSHILMLVGLIAHSCQILMIPL